MEIQRFRELLAQQNTELHLLDFCRKHVLHGTPAIFRGAEDEFYEFRKRIADRFKISFHEIYIIGSAKLGFSPYKLKEFDYDSDIDLALISLELFESFMDAIALYQMKFRQARYVVRESELATYHEFLEYVAIGWIRPDKLPISFQMRAKREDWFNFFESMSYGKSEVGDYKVNAGIFRSYQHLETYIVSGLESVQKRLKRKM